MKREPGKNIWEKYWSQRKTDEFYSDSERVVHNLVKVTDVKNKCILEVGAGTGRDSVTLTQMGAKVYLIDYSRESIKKIKELSSNNKLCC